MNISIHVINRNICRYIPEYIYKYRLKSILPCCQTCRSLYFKREIQSISTASHIAKPQVSHEDGFFKRFLKRFVFKAFGKRQLLLAGSLLYTKLDKRVDLYQFFKVCQLPDTFFSWYLVTELHVWLLSVRLMAEGDHGREVRDALFKALWLDIEERSKKLGGASPSVRKKQTYELQDQFLHSMLAYDEALSGSDQVLASALWRIIFHKNCDDPEILECLVQYVRKNLVELEKVSKGELILNRFFRFEPLLEPEKIRRTAI